MTVPESFHFLRGQTRFMREHGFVVTAVASPGTYHTLDGAELLAVDMPRSITPLRDVVAVIGLMRVFARRRPDIVHAHTPKGGLLGMLAASLARVPVRVYHMRGLPFTTQRGWRRLMLLASERVSCALAHRVFCVSHSLRAVAVAHGLCAPEKIVTFLAGSGNGVDAAGHFAPRSDDSNLRNRLRRDLGIPSDAFVLGYVGRLVRDKGIAEMAVAWSSLRDEFPSMHLIIVGNREQRDAVAPSALAVFDADARVHFTGPVDDSRSMYVAMDVVTLPSYREGFPNVPLEAAAMGLPVVSTTAPGCVDAVENGITGLLVPPADSTSLASALRRYAGNPGLALRHGLAGRARVLRDFRSDRIWRATRDEYMRLIQQYRAVAR